MAEAERRLALCEEAIIALRRRLQDDEARIARLENFISQLGGLYGGPGVASNLGYIAPVVISAAGNVTNQTVKSLLGGAGVTLTTTATVYNIMAVGTVATAGKNIIVAPNGDGTWLAVTQSC